MRYFAPGTMYVTPTVLLSIADYRTLEREAKRLRPIKGKKNGVGRLTYAVTDLLKDIIEDKLKEINYKEVKEICSKSLNR